MERAPTARAGLEPVAAAVKDDGIEHMRFRFTEIDFGGSWNLHKIRPPEHERLLRKLKNLETITPSQATKNHVLTRLDMSKCRNKQATRRLANQYEGLDVLHELRIEPSQSGRLLGRLEGRFFNIIWWDPNHEVWPEGKQAR